MATSKKLLVVAAITTVGTEDITLFMKDGSTKSLPKDEYRTQQILQKVLPNAAIGKVTDLTIESYKIHAEFVDATKKRVQFYAVPKSYVSATRKLTATGVKKNGSILGDAEITDEQTLIAIMDGKKIVHGVENLETQIQHSVMTSPIGMLNFLERVAKMIDTRGHTVEDLLKFLKLSDLPISDEGDIIAYKAVYADGDGQYVDCHTRKVKQKIGSYVFMADEMVDPNRSASCSQGLHICSRRYLRSFSGDKILICRIPPENFIAVPYNEAEKVRVSGYHILAEVNDEAFSALKSNKPITTDLESAQLVGDILVGKHINITEKVEIRAPKGGDLKIKKVAKSEVKKPTRKSEATTALDPDAKSGQNKVKASKVLSSAEMNKKIRTTQAKKGSQSSSQPDERIKAALVEMKAGKLSNSAIAKKYDTSTRTLGRWMDKYGSSISRFEGATPEQVTALAAIEQGKTKKEAAAIGKTSTRTIGRWMEKFGVTHPE